MAEQAKMLAALHPGRIDLGVGRSLGFTAPVRDALGVHDYGPDDFAGDISALVDLLADAGPVTAMPKGVPAPPLFVLATGSGLAVAARLGLPVVVGGPLVHGDLTPLADYRAAFRPRHPDDAPRVLVSVDVLVADAPARARDLVLPEAWAMVESRTTGAFPPLRPEPAMRLTARQQEQVERHLDQVVHGTVTDVAEQLTAIVDRTAADEVLAFSSTHDRAALRDSDAALATLHP